MARIQSFKANCSLKLYTAGSNKEIVINPLYIRSMAMDYKFDTNIMPIVYTILDVDIEMYDTIVENATDGRFLVQIVNYDANLGSTGGIRKYIVNDEFIYFLPNKYNYAKKLEDPGVDNTDGSGNTLHMVIGLMKAQLIYNNKVSFNGVYENTTTELLLEKVLKGLPKLTMDEIENNKEYEESFTLLPQQTRAQAIDYIFTDNPFYNTDYIFFMDFKKTYLLNSTGGPREDIDNHTVLFQIVKSNSAASYYNGVVKDAEDGVYVIYVDQSDANFNINTTTDKVNNQIVAYDTDEVTKEDLNVTVSKVATTNKQEFAMVNQLGTDIRKNIMDNTAVTLNITKMNMDSSIITPDKCYQVKHALYPDYDGKYLIMYKKDIISRAGEAFDTTTIIGLQRIND
jgi:hypothetical protein